ncbi:TetR family transcriptional regulator C-terminal domain-containing protein [Seonamhaeicola marinus]|uniref:Uncharacterized protein n=1 Tax=Seonamhaeicola marinus TaxID=1912246 RepID=A0A5D0HRM5_9FLAO|nr:TetR family transcriptional regulator C-terminal domain-containing protein [Seonamhaeicola marinus]TYA73996.1 hypothetical protein FUA24_11660 [Seonamhaeicola marinus]
MSLPYPGQQEFNSFQSIFNECLMEVENESDVTIQFDVDVVSQFLIFSWLGAFFRLETNQSTSPKEDFKAFILQQLMN